MPYIEGLEVKNPNLITVLWSCRHIWIQLRPAGIADPLNCWCFSCNPEPIANHDFVCPDCAVKAMQERRAEAIKNSTFEGKPQDSECFYGFHDQCHGCNCSCHKYQEIKDRYQARNKVNYTICGIGV